MKRYLAVLMSLVILFMGVLPEVVYATESGTEEDTDNQVQTVTFDETQYLFGLLEITKAELELNSETGMTSFCAWYRNVGEVDSEVKTVTVYFFDENKNVLYPSYKGILNVKKAGDTEATWGLYLSSTLIYPELLNATSYKIVVDETEEISMDTLSAEIEKGIIFNDETGIPDENLYKEALSHADADGNGILTKTEAEKVTSFSSNGKNISDITGLEYFCNLEQLYLGENKISDISALSNLTKLVHLFLPENEISDISPLANLNVLSGLYISGNNISDIEPLKNLEDLSYGLDLSDNQISDISVLAEISTLRNLRLNNNEISDISALQNLNLQSLELNGNKIRDISALKNQTNLTKLYLADNRISDIGALEQLVNLRWIQLNDNYIKDASVLDATTSLCEINLSNSRISDITWLDNENMSSGEQVLLGQNPINELSVLNDIIDILSGNYMKFSISDSEGFDLEDLQQNEKLANCRVVILRLLNEDGTEEISEPIYNFLSKKWTYRGEEEYTQPKVNGYVPASEDGYKTVNVTYNRQETDNIYVDFYYKSVEGIIPNDETGIPDENFYYAALDAADANGDGYLTVSEAEKVSELELNDENISDITGIRFFNKVHHLQMSDNNISDISELSQLERLSRLALENNEISDISAISNLTRMSELKLNGNAISDISPLAGLTNVRCLHLADNNISDISALSGLTEVSYPLDLSNNKIRDISPLGELTRIDQLFLNGNLIEDVSPLANLEISILELNNNRIKDISPLKDYSSGWLYLENNQISDMSWLKQDDVLNWNNLRLAQNEMNNLDFLNNIDTIGAISISESEEYNLERMLEHEKLSDCGTVVLRLYNEDGTEEITERICYFLSESWMQTTGWYTQPKVNGYIPASEGGYETVKVTYDRENKETIYVDFYYKSIKKPVEVAVDDKTDTSDSQADTKIDTQIDTPLDELLDGILTDDDKWIAETGGSVSITFTINDITVTISATEKKNIDDKAAEEGFQGGKYIDISLKKIVNEKEDAVTETKDLIEITISIPEDLKNNDPKKTREFSIARMHNGKVEILENFSENENEIKFKTDRFSTYAIVYKDIDKDTTAVSEFVKRLYTLVLEREVDEGGLDSWVNVLLSGESNGVDAGYGFVFSKECVDRRLSNEQFVEILYNTFMNRPSDAAGKEAWVSQLDAGVDREKIFEGFVYSPEFAEICQEYGISVGSTDDVDALAEVLDEYHNQNSDITKFVGRCYIRVLLRGFDMDGLESWCKVIIEKENTPKEVAQNFIFSDEFVSRNLSDEEYVKVLYRTFMGREADEAGLAGWVAVLESGEEDRAKVLEGFANSEEFAEILESFGLE